MFRSARIRLTAWYLLIIILISAAFSIAIYLGVSNDIERRFSRLESKLMRDNDGLKMPRGMHQIMHGHFLEARNRILLILIIVNGSIVIISSGAGYFLAGKTLEPIEESLEEQKRFVADASHELRTPLTSLKTSIEVALRDKKLNKQTAKDVLSNSLEDVDNLETLASDLLILAQSDASNQKISFETVDLAPIVERARKNVEPTSRKKSTSLQIEVEPLVIEAQAQSLEKLLTILLDNALKYTQEKGKIILTAVKDGNSVVFKINDDGIGIDEKDISHIFDRFYRVDQSRSKNKIAGFGLGLSIAKRIVDTHKGSIDVTSTLGSGSTFTIKLPLGES